MNISKKESIQTKDKFDINEHIEKARKVFNIFCRVMTFILFLQFFCINAGLVSVEFKGYYIGSKLEATKDLNQILGALTPGGQKNYLDSLYKRKTPSSALPVKIDVAEEEILSNHKDSKDYSWTEVKLTRKIKEEYINKIAPIAQRLARETDIPASIKIAQACVESRYGTSRLAMKSKNHFGIKCHSKNCKKGHCTNANDDHHKDFFKNFISIEDSFKGHTFVLEKPRYSTLFNIKRSRNGKPDYEKWAVGLKRCGYATSKRYPNLIISMVKKHNLTKYDDKYLN